MGHATLFRSLVGALLCACAGGKSNEWYETTTIYQIYPRSFKDSNGDGVGDLKGIYEKLDYVRGLGVETLWIQTFLNSPMRGLDHDISDFKQVDPLFGTLDDAKHLIKAIHDKGMRVMLDFVPNHTSNESEWFQKSEEEIAPYKDYYVWKTSKDWYHKKQNPPNNWLSVFGGSAWEWSEVRQEFYLHQFSAAQPDLNYRNPAVKAAMTDVLRFWLDVGVDGFRVNAIAHLVEDNLLRDNPWVSPDVMYSKNYHDQKHTYSEDREETYEITHQWRMLLDEYKKKDGRTRIMVVETNRAAEEMNRFLGNETYENMHLPLNPNYPGLFDWPNAAALDKRIRTLVEQMQSTAGAPSWVLSNGDIPRLASRMSRDFSEAALMIQLLLPGVASVYYGDEIAMEDVELRPDQVVDPSYNPKTSIYLRDKARAPMQWDDSNNAGFTWKKEAWLPVNTNYWRNNVKKQLEDPKSHLNTFKRLMELRKLAAVKDGRLETCIVSSWLYMFQRVI